MNIQWDDKANHINFSKYGIRFEEARAILNKESVSLLDDRERNSDTRYMTLGYLHGGIVAIHYTYEGETLHLLSIKHATEEEKKLYNRLTK